MRYVSTRGGQGTGLVDAALRGLAPDGGLYVPDELPRVDAAAVQGESLAEIAAEVLAPFFEGSGLAAELGGICRDAFNFPLPLKELAENGELSVLELFHGPTAAFKDVGARFLAALLERALRRSSDARPLTILVATSGDTGGAVAAAFHRRRGIRVAVLFPKGQVSPRQQHQLTCWGDNIRAFEVDGTFDACQALVKGAFNDAGLQRRHRLTAANSINIGRLLPQVAYHAAASLWHWRRHGTTAGSIVPSGNLGNGMACVWARAMGLPVREIVLAVNANRTIPDYLSTGQWQPRPSVATLASAMDVGDPSNFERLRTLLPDFAELRAAIESYPVDDAAIRAEIAKGYAQLGEVWCPHTATAFWVYDHLPAARKAGRPWIVSATAHPAKFDTIVEPVIGRAVPVPPALAELLDRPTASTPLAARLEQLVAEIDAWK
ncbi:MAG TPA: threonine synthase [Gammaproteobacteria bacterium]